MATRLVFYDITDDRHRTRLAKKLEAWGFERIQYSVFCGKCTEAQWQRYWKVIQHQAQKYGDGSEKIYAVIISTNELKNMLHLGEKPDLSIALNEKITIWF